MPHEQIKENKLFANIGKLITSSLELEKILKGVMDEIKLYFDPEHWSLMRYDHTSKMLFFMLIEGVTYEAVENISLKLGEGIAGAVVQSGNSIYAPDTSQDPFFTDKVDKITGFKTESVIAVPVKMNNHIFGVIEIINSNIDNFFTADEHIILQSIADFTAIAFANNMLYEKALTRGEIDTLTGLYNKAKLTDYTNKHCKVDTPHRRDSDSAPHIIVVYIDLNKFKEINDTYGHKEGDEVLRRVAMRLRSVFRSDDLIFRIGGDEFIILIELEDETKCTKIIERISEVLTNVKVTSIKKGYTITLSFGIEQGKQHDLDKLIHDADMSMYKKKKNGN